MSCIAKDKWVNLNFLSTVISFSRFILVSALLFPALLEGNDVQKRIVLEHVITDQKLSQHGIQCIIQDRKGFIWVGTQGGLNRFDGYNFISYLHEPFNAETISDNYIRALVEDQDGMLWIGTRGGGLNHFNPGTGQARHFKLDPGNLRSLGSNYVEAIILDRQGRLWVGTYGGGLNLLDRTTMTFTRFLNDPSDPSTLSSDRVISLAEDRSGRIWVGTEDGGLNRMAPGKCSFIVFRHQEENVHSLCHDYVSAIFQDRQHNLWVGTGGGLELFLESENRFVHYPPDPGEPNSLNHPLVSVIVEDREGYLWIGTGNSNTIGRGLNIFDPGTRSFSQLPIGSKRSQGAPLTVSAIYLDRTGIMWVGTMGDGLYKYVPHKHRFPVCLYDPETPGQLMGDRVWAIYETDDGKLWVSTLGSGLNCWDRGANRWTHYLNRPDNPDSPGDNSIRSLLEDRDGYLWLGTDNGLDRFDRQSGKFTHLRSNPGDIHSISSNMISCLTEDPGGYIWVGTWGGGLNRLDKTTNQFTRFPFQPGNPRSLNDDKITTVFSDFNRTLWVGTSSNGLNRWDAKHKRFIHYTHDPGDPGTISCNTVMSIYQDNPDTLWIGTWGGGLNKLDIASGTFTVYIHPYAPTNRSIMGLLGDKNHNLWMSTTNGIFKYDPRVNIFTNYTVADGLQGDEFNQDSYFMSSSGEIFFGGTNGFNYFYPENIKTNIHIPAIVFTEFKIFGKPVPLIAGDFPRIHLDYWENHFSFEFAALEYTNPLNNRYAYKMDGFDSDWIFCGTRRHATYTNLDAGNYTFRVMASNNDGIWNTEGISVQITIIPAFWQTFWFRVLLALVLITALVLLILLRTRYLHREIARQEKYKRRLQYSRDELKKAKKLVEFQHGEVLQLVAAISSILIAVDARGNIYEWNTPAESFFGLPRSAVIGRSFVQVLSPSIKNTNLHALLSPGRNDGSTGNPAGKQDVEVNFKDDYRLLSVTVNPIFDHKKSHLGVLLICEDITDRRAEESRKNLLLKLKSIGQMHASISHQINNPLLYIRVNSQTISRFLLDLDSSRQRIKQFLNSLPRGTRRSVALETWKVFDANRFENDLQNGLDAIRMIEQGNQNVMEIVKAMKEFFHPGNTRMEKCNINELLTSTLIVGGYDIRNIADIETHFDEELPMIDCFPAQLNQVFLNLLVNAADAIEETANAAQITEGKIIDGKSTAGKIKILTRQEPGKVIIEVADTGPGIPDAIAEKIFTPFFTTKRKGIGTGMGLSMAKKIIEENHGGKIFFHSSPAGTTFYIILPIEQQSVPKNELGPSFII